MSQNRNERTPSWLELAICRILGISTTPPGEVGNKQKNNTTFKSTISVKNVSNSRVMAVDDGTVSIGNITDSRVGDKRLNLKKESAATEQPSPKAEDESAEKGKLFPATAAEISINASSGKVDLQTSDAAGVFMSRPIIRKIGVLPTREDCFSFAKMVGEVVSLCPIVVSASTAAASPMSVAVVTA